MPMCFPSKVIISQRPVNKTMCTCVSPCSSVSVCCVLRFCFDNVSVYFQYEEHETFYFCKLAKKYTYFRSVLVF